VKVLVIGGGGREHALAWALSRDPKVDELYVAPGNPGIAEIAKCVPINATKLDDLASFAKRNKVDLTVVGPEQPLALGIVDVFQKQKLLIFGPDQKAAKIESSKSYAKGLCLKFHIPTPKWQAFSDAKQALEALDQFGPPWVVKADGLAAGKGTIVTRDRRDAEEAVKRELQHEGGRVVCEEFIDGWEATFMSTVSSGRVQWLTPAFQDYKPIYDGDLGPNTGGMGGYTPIPTVTRSLMEKVKDSILTPMIEAMERTGVHFQGVLNLNAIIEHGTEDPYVLEFNARFGDPECQGIMALVQDGLVEHLSLIASDANSSRVPQTSSSASVVVVLASKGYPSSQSFGDRITIRPYSLQNVRIMHAGTARNQTGELVTGGGRVLDILATGESVESARQDAYAIIGNAVYFDGMQYRRDIGTIATRRRPLQVTRT
jgi:phosphoribosylamine---glycine ligase